MVSQTFKLMKLRGIVTMAKLLYSSVVSTKNDKYLIADIQHFYFNNKLDDPEFMELHISIILQ